MSFSGLFKPIESILKKEDFIKKGICWNRINNRIIWVVCFQKGKAASKTEFDLTINIGAYISGTHELIFGNKPKAIVDANCFFKKRPVFFGCDKDWWTFDSNADNNSSVRQIQLLIEERVFPFLKENNTFDKLVSILPIDLWKVNTNFHSDLLKVACGYLINGNQSMARDLLNIIINKQTIWAEKAIKILQTMNSND